MPFINFFFEKRKKRNKELEKEEHMSIWTRYVHLFVHQQNFCPRCADAYYSIVFYIYSLQLIFAVEIMQII